MMNDHRATLCLWSVVMAICLATFGFRIQKLDQRPMHGDEANQAIRTGVLLERGLYHYDPTDHHGPVLYYAARPFCRATAKTLSATTEWNFRLVPVAFSILTLLLMVGLHASDKKGLFTNTGGLLAAILFTALSPAMNYYSRFFIQETLFVTFLTGMLACAVQYVRAEKGGRAGAGFAAGFGLFAGLAAATKETLVLSLAAAGLAMVFTCGFRRLLKAWNTRDFLIALGVCACVAMLFFTSFLTYPKGAYDALFSTMTAYLSRATAVPEHQHPWNFYVKNLLWFQYGKGPIWSELGLLILPIGISIAAVFRNLGIRNLRSENAAAASAPVPARWLRFLLLYTFLLTAIYSLIPYKTPWCMLSFLHGYILLAGAGIGWLLENGMAKSRRIAFLLVVFLFLAACQQIVQTRRCCLRYPADVRNPYVYAHTGTDALNLIAAIDQAARKESGFSTPIAVAAPAADTWPLPWYLRKYEAVGYWQNVSEIPADFNPAILVVAADQGDRADQRFGKDKQATFFGIRPGVLLNLFLKKDAAGSQADHGPMQ